MKGREGNELFAEKNLNEKIWDNGKKLVTCNLKYHIFRKK